MYEVQNLYEV